MLRDVQRIQLANFLDVLHYQCSEYLPMTESIRNTDSINDVLKVLGNIEADLVSRKGPAVRLCRSLIAATLSSINSKRFDEMEYVERIHARSRISGFLAKYLSKESIRDISIARSVAFKKRFPRVEIVDNMMSDTFVRDHRELLIQLAESVILRKEHRLFHGNVNSRKYVEHELSEALYIEGILY